MTLSELRGLNIGFTSVQLILFGKEVILFDRFGSSGGNIDEFNDIDVDIVFKVTCDCENDDAEFPCMLTLANTAKSCAEDDELWPVGDCSPSLVL